MIHYPQENMENLFVFLFLFSFVTLIVGLIKPSLFSRVIKNSTRKKVGLILGGITFVFLILIGTTIDTSSVDTNTENKDQESVSTNEVEEKKVAKQEEPTPTVDELAEYREVALPVIAKLDAANQAIAKTSEYGAQLEFELAQVFLDQAESSYKEAKGIIDSISPPQEAQEAHKLLLQAIDEYLISVSLYQDGIRNLDSDVINEGIGVYEEATDTLNKAAEEFVKLN